MSDKQSPAPVTSVTAKAPPTSAPKPAPAPASDSPASKRADSGPPAPRPQPVAPSSEDKVDAEPPAADDDAQVNKFKGSFASFGAGEELQDAAGQADRKWRDDQDVLQNLKDNPNLATYSDKQIDELNTAASLSDKFRDRIASTTAHYAANETDELADLPESASFQRLLSNTVVNADLDELSSNAREDVAAAQEVLQDRVAGNLNTALADSAEGKEGEQGIEDTITEFNDRSADLLERNPALQPYFAEKAKELGASESTADLIQDIEDADDGLVADLGGALRDAGDWFGDKGGDVLSSFALSGGNPTSAAMGLANPEDHGVVGDLVEGAVDRPFESFVGGVTGTLDGALDDPAAFAEGIYNLTPQKLQSDLMSGKPIDEVLGERIDLGKKIGETFISDYRETFEEEGDVAGVAHIGSDILTTVLTGGAGKLGKGLDLAAAGNKLGDNLDGLLKGGKLDDLLQGGKLGDAVANSFSGAGGAADELLAGSKASPWLRDLVSEAAGNAQSSALYDAANGYGKELEKKIEELLAGLAL